MPEVVQVDPKLVEDKINIARRNLRKPGLNFYEEIASRDSPLGSGTLSLEASIAVSSFEKFIGTAAAFRESINRNGLLDGYACAHDVKEQFADMFSLFVGAAAGNAVIDKAGNEVKPIPLGGKHGIDFTRGDYFVLDDLVSTYISGTSRSRNGETLVSYTRDFYDWVIGQAVEQHKDSRFADLVRKAEGAHVKVNGFIVNGLHCREFDKAQTTPAAYNRDDYVGNSELLDTLRHSLTELFDYHFKEKKNPNIELGGFQQTVTVWGGGGMGKSMGIAIALNEAKALADKKGIPFLVRELRGFKSEYFAKSTQNLRAIFEEIRKGDAVYAIVAEDIDTIFYAREELKNRAEDKDILGELMNQLEGLTSNQLGNYVFIATSNHPLQGDGPLMDRLRQCQVHVKGPLTPADYSAVFKAKLRDGIKQGYAIVSNWDRIGGLAQKHSLSNRDIRNICLEFLAKTKNYDRTDSFYAMGYAERAAYLRKQHAKVNDDALACAIEGYAKGIEDQRKKEFDSAVEQGICQQRLAYEIARRMREEA